MSNFNQPILQPIDIPDGSYEGLMTGYTMKFHLDDGTEVHGTTEIGVRGINCPHEFVVRDGEIVTESIKSISKLWNTKFRYTKESE